ncbi:DUF4365 domain-containing protein [Lentzea aerocolonigenes]|uniref:DUF4365 domain-containing protein n=1 Tax=Lentzea aerocolonigenes TaxID=68170 RepID=UPI003AF52F99
MPERQRGRDHTQLAIQDELGWLFREQPTEDYGIDAHVEVVDGEDVRGRLLALQIVVARSTVHSRLTGSGSQKSFCSQ